jgi:hypothetical protein
MVRIQELNEDGSPRLDDNGNPIYQTITEETFYELMDTPIGKKRWLRVREEIKNKPVESEPGTILHGLYSHTHKKTTRKGTK